MYPSHPVEGRQPSECDATSRYADRVEAAAEGLSNSKDSSSAAPPAASKNSAASWSGPCTYDTSPLFPQSSAGLPPLRVRSEAPVMRRKEPADDVSCGWAAVASCWNFAAASIGALGRFSRDLVAAATIPRVGICTYPGSSAEYARFGLSFGAEWLWANSLFAPSSRPTSFGN